MKGDWSDHKLEKNLITWFKIIFAWSVESKSCGVCLCLCLCRNLWADDDDDDDDYDDDGDDNDEDDNKDENYKAKDHHKDNHQDDTMTAMYFLGGIFRFFCIGGTIRTP